jgi:hypothetical protein
MIPKSGHRFSAFAKPASAGEGRSVKIMRNQVHAQGRSFPCLEAADFSSQKRVNKPA